jgi:hypothetical protein
MSVEKRTILKPSEHLFQPVSKKDENPKLNHIYKIISELHEQLKAKNPKGKYNKYDFICKNIDEVLLLNAFRNKQFDEFKKKENIFKKLINKI